MTIDRRSMTFALIRSALGFGVGAGATIAATLIEAGDSNLHTVLRIISILGLVNLALGMNDVIRAKERGERADRHDAISAGAIFTMAAAMTVMAVGWWTPIGRAPLDAADFVCGATAFFVLARKRPPAHDRA